MITNQEKIISNIARKAISQVRPQFLLDFNDGVHGIAHWSRVCTHGRRLAYAMDLNPQVTTWFAFLHDSRRENDHYDPEHGSRAADFACNLRKRGVITELDDFEFEQLCEAMKLHSDGHIDATPLIRACWDSDRLDLGRSNNIPDPERLCTEMARRPEVIEEAVRLSQGIALASVDSAFAMGLKGQAQRL